MSNDAVKKYAVKIEYYYQNDDDERALSQGSGVIFKSHEKDQTCYILTAKHIFFPDKNNPKTKHESFLENSLDIKINNILVFIESDPDNNIIHTDIKINFLRNKRIDIVFIILTALEEKVQREISTLEIFDLENNICHSKNFFISGYPRITKNIEQVSKLTPYIVQHSQFDENGQVKMLCKSSPVLSMGKIRESMQGISGAGTFIQERDGKLNLSHIQFGVIEPNIFLCTRLDIFADEINKTITLDHTERYPISINTKIIIDNEDLNFDDYSNLDFFKNKIRNNTLAYNKSITKAFNIEINPSIFDEDLLDSITIQESVDKLRKVYKEIEQQSIALSYLYAYLAILAHENKFRRTTTLLFKKAINLNPEHKQAFILEKAKRTNNFEKIQQTLLISLEETINFHESLISIENDSAIKITKIKSAILDIIKCEGDDIQKNQEIENYLKRLESAYESNHILREPYKYQELGEFYFSLGYKEKTLYFLHAAIYLLSDAPQTQSNISMMESIKQQLDEITIDNDIDYEKIKNNANNKALQIIKAQEDQNIKKTLEKVNQMLGTVYDDIYHIKLDEQKRKETITNLDNSLKLLKSKVEIQIDQNYSYNLDAALINENIVKLDIFNNLLTEQLNSIQDKYHIQIDDETRNELRSIIEESTATMNSALGKINTTADQANDYIKTSEAGLKTLIGHEQDGLSSIHKEIQNNLNEFSKQQIKLTTEKNEVLEFLKSSESRILAKIHKLDTNTKHKNKTIELIQGKISQLQKLVNTATIIQSKNHSDLVKSANNTTNDLKKIIITCQELEKSVLDQLKSPSDYTDDITIIKRSQNRFEKSLLNQTKNAFANYEKITEYNTTRPSLSFSQKVLLSIYFIIMIACAIYFIINYSLLDLLTNLWHTA